MAVFDATSTTDDVLAGRDLSGLNAIVTGVSAGLGVETARALAARGAAVVGTARDIAKAERATADARRDAEAGGGSIELAALDLADLSSVRRCADALLDRGAPIDLLVANAGVMMTPFGRTADGFETQFGTNFVGHFVLANRLAPLMRQGARLVVLTSAGHRYADVDLDDPGFERTPYDPVLGYGRSKTADVLLAVAFDRRHRGRGVRAAAVHPGAVMTELGRHLDAEHLRATLAAIEARLAAEGKPPFRFKTVPQGAATTVWAGVAAEADAVGGRYCENCRVGPLVPDDAAIDAVSEGVRGYALDPARAEALWLRAEAMVGERF